MLNSPYERPRYSLEGFRPRKTVCSTSSIGINQPKFRRDLNDGTLTVVCRWTNAQRPTPTYAADQVVINSAEKQWRCVGSFRLATKYPHLHGRVYFAGVSSKTVQESLRYSTSRNLHDKVLRYITTVKVTASARIVLSSALARFRLLQSAEKTSDDIHYFANWHRPVFLINSSPCQFLLPKFFSSNRRTFFRSYSAILPSSLEPIFPLVLACSANRLVSDYVQLTPNIFLPTELRLHNSHSRFTLIRIRCWPLVVDNFRSNLETVLN